jgi:integrase
MNKLEKFLRMYGKGTARGYKWGIAKFFETIYGNNEDKVEEHAERYFNEERDVEKDMEDFFLAIKDKPPKSVKLMLTGVRGFLIENDVELPQKFWRRLRRKIRGSRALTIDKVPSNLELRRIIMHMPVQGKALFLTLSSSGMRIGEALRLKEKEDVDLTATPGRINIRGEYTKTGNSRIAFISQEAAVTLQEWLKVRDKYLHGAAGRSHRYHKDVEDDRLFPFESNTAYYVWKQALKKAGFGKRDASTNRRQLHPHVLRKFFRTRLGTVIPVDVTEALMGHEAYLTEVYRRYTVEDLAKFYMQGEAALLVFTEAEEVSKLRVEVQERNKQLQTFNLELQNRLARMENENVDLKRRIQQTEDKLANLEKLIRKTREEI